MKISRFNWKLLLTILVSLFSFIELYCSEYLVPRQARAIDYADIDLDNDMDIVVSCYYTNTIPDTIAILLNDGTGLFSVNNLQKETLHFLKCFKVDNDDLPDLVTKILEDYQFVYYHNNGDGSFGEAILIHSTLSDHYEKISVADINNDGDNDIVFWKSGFDPYWGILHNNGYGGFTENVYYTAETIAMGLDVGKINDDEYDDVLLTTGEGPLIFYNDLPYFIESVPDSFICSNIYSLDMDNDGNNDVGLYQFQSAGEFDKFKILYNSGDGTFADADTIMVSWGSIITDINDFNNDGYPDLVYFMTVGSAFELIYVMLNDQNGDFLEPACYNLGYPTYFISCTADFDNNGYNDLAITGYNVDFTHDGVSLLFNDGTGNFVEEPQANFSEECKIENVKCKINNYPNPFNPVTTISYELPYGVAKPIIEIFNIKGEHIRELKIDPPSFHYGATGNEELRTNSVVWDGTDNYRNQVSSGVYLYRLVDDGNVLTSQKMILMK
ncbi:MAG: FG-GAP-like repeat-containing protein [Candidatus Cloacimonetes bacterium]|nr:FG-GAP-like repeat-containing protein [Candidatus Cloacimonadota bacterium]